MLNSNSSFCMRCGGNERALTTLPCVNDEPMKHFIFLFFSANISHRCPRLQDIIDDDQCQWFRCDAKNSDAFVLLSVQINIHARMQIKLMFMKRKRELFGYTSTSKAVLTRDQFRFKGRWDIHYFPAISFLMMPHCTGFVNLIAEYFVIQIFRAFFSIGRK